MTDADLIANLLKGKAISRAALQAAQESYEGNPEYGLTDQDMKKAIAAAISVLLKKQGTPERDARAAEAKRLLEKAAQIAGDAFWSLPMPKHWDRDKEGYANWCSSQSKRVREKITALAGEAGE